MKIIATTAFGLESVTARELKNLGYENIKTENGCIEFEGSSIDVARTNLWLRTADRILIKCAEFEAVSFEELFQGVKNIEWGDIMPENAEMHVVGKSINSKLFSVPDCQSITKKAIVEKMKEKYKREVFEEDGAKYKISVSILKDVVKITLDTSGTGLHKRGYRRLTGDAPLKETLASALILLSFWKDERLLIDPLCGTGTIPIEAAFISLNRAPGLKRTFVSENWDLIDKTLWVKAREEALDLEKKDRNLNIFGSDIDPKAIELSQIHAREADVDEHIHFKQMNVRDLVSTESYGFIITNPPYGERLGELKQVEDLYRQMGKTFRELDKWSYYIISSCSTFENCFGKKADKRRKLYNGRLECQYFQYIGEKPNKIFTEK